MQDQGKRLLVAVALAVAVLFAWQFLFGKRQQPPPGAGSAALAGSAAATGPKVIKPPVTPPVKRGPEQTVELAFPRFAATFSNWGGELKSWRLTDGRYLRDATHGELLPDLPDEGAFAVDFAGSTYVIPPKAEWHLDEQTETGVVYSYADDHLDVQKTFAIVPDAYIVRATISVKVKADAAERLVVSAFEVQDPKTAGGGSSRVAARAWQSSTDAGGTIRSTDIAALAKEGPRFEKNAQWTGFEHPYLLVAIAPKPEPGVQVEKHTYLVDGSDAQMRTDMVYSERKGPGKFTEDLVAYLGPKNYDQLENANAVAGFDTGFKDAIDLGWFAFIGRPLLWLLQKFFELVGNWGLAIVMLTLSVKLATLYFTTKSMRSMKKMAALAPQMKALQEKYKDDRQGLQEQTMALYKQHGVNPVAGCLPMLLQMPIWIALYRMLSNAGELYQQPFIHGWVDDLTATDPYYILPILLIVTWFAQSRLTPQTGDSRQQKLMQYGIPLMFGAMSIFFPAGLTLYMITNAILSAVHSIYMNKFDKQTLASMVLLKKNQAAAAKAAAKPDAKAVIDVKSAEAGDAPDGDDASEDASDVAQAAAGAARGRRRKKRRR